MTIRRRSAWTVIFTLSLSAYQIAAAPIAQADSVTCRFDASGTGTVYVDVGRDSGAHLSLIRSPSGSVTIVRYRSTEPGSDPFAQGPGIPCAGGGDTNPARSVVIHTARFGLAFVTVFIDNWGAGTSIEIDGPSWHGLALWGTSGPDRIHTGGLEFEISDVYIDGLYLYGLEGDDDLSLDADSPISAEPYDPSYGWEYETSYVWGGDGNDILSSFLADGVDFEGYGGDDTLHGGPGPDRMNGGAGDDLVFGGGGDDGVHESAFEGEDGENRIFGGPGNDLLLGGTGDDLLDGGAGDDSVYGGMGHDVIYGRKGSDALSSTENGLLSGDSGGVIYGGPGKDVLTGGPREDVLTGGPGADMIIGFGGADTLFGGAGDDVLWGGWGPDQILGGDGEDLLFGGQGEDALEGEAGNDTLFGSGQGVALVERDVLDGGSGRDGCSGYVSLPEGIDPGSLLTYLRCESEART